MKKTILLVDDDCSILESLSKLLGTEGYEIIKAENGQQSVEMLVNHHVDIILLDLGLPVTDGWGTLRWLAQVNPLLPVIIITGQSHQCEPATKMGADVLMEKPLNVPRLLQAIRDLLDEPMKCRVQRAIQRPAGLLYVPSEIEHFRESMQKAVPFSTPRGQG